MNRESLQTTPAKATKLVQTFKNHGPHEIKLKAVKRSMFKANLIIEADDTVDEVTFARVVGIIQGGLNAT